MRQVISREVALTEAYLDHQAQLQEPTFPRASACVWASEIAKAAVWLVGLVLLILAMAILAPESRGDSINVSFVASELDAGTVLPLAGGVDRQLANNLIQAQNLAWGRQWLDGSLELSVDGVLKAIGLYVWPGGPTEITRDQQEFVVVWASSHVAVDPRLSVGFDTTSIDFGEVPVVSTPEPSTLVVLLFGLVGLGTLLWITKRDARELSREV